MTEDALKILELLPEDGSKITGGEILEQIEIGPQSFKNAKRELADLGLVILGRGRGGSVSKVVGAELPVEEPKMSKGEIIALAREAKASKSRESKKTAAIRQYLTTKISKEYDVEEEKVKVFYGPDSPKVVVEIWGKKGEGAKVYGLLPEVLEEAEQNV